MSQHSFTENYFKSITELHDFWSKSLSKNPFEINKACNPMAMWSMFQKNQQPQSVFAPHIVQKTMNCVAEEIKNQWIHNPKSFNDLQKTYMSHMENLSKGVLEGMQTGTFSSFVKEEARDRRFKDDEWQNNPIFNYFKQVYLLNARFLKESMDHVENIDAPTKKKLDFYVQHLIDALSPSNFPLTNPQVIRETMETQGQNLLKGYQNFLEDMKNGSMRMTDTSAFSVGETLAITPGDVVYQNDLFQLIQYAPTTQKAAKRPLLVVPPWINKYYIFDLQDHNSFIKWMVDQGFSVFLMSWVNPDKRHMDKTSDDYIIGGIYQAIKQVKAITQEEDLNLLGYCAGGIFTMMLMSYLNQIKDSSVKSLSLFAAPVDARKMGALDVYICEDQLIQLEEYMKNTGYLEGQALMNSFNLIRANDLIWSYYINNYLLGKDPFPFDMLYWNNDPVRMPSKLYISYLRDIFLHNGLMKKDGLKVKDISVDLSCIDEPLFVMGTVDDHIAPWASVYPIMDIAKSADKMFVLASSGHVAGVMNHPSKNKYHYFENNACPTEGSDQWMETAQKTDGSWWPKWSEWLKKHSGKEIKARALNPRYRIEKAPGSFVKVK
jgi:polyhydroxyalkanoate synthase